MAGMEDDPGKRCSNLKLGGGGGADTPVKGEGKVYPGDVGEGFTSKERGSREGVDRVPGNSERDSRGLCFSGFRSGREGICLVL